MAPTGNLTVRLANGAWSVALTVGILSVLLGIAIVAWPKATIGVVAVLFGIDLITVGVYRIAQAVIVSDAGGGTRALFAMLGILSFAVGVLALRHLLQTVEVLAILFGLFWLTVGIVELIAAVTGEAATGRGAGIVISILSILAGVVMLAFPGITLLALTWLLGIWLITWGLLTAGLTMWIRHADKQQPGRARP